MTKQELIKAIIEIQTSKKHLFVKVANENDLKQNTKAELYFIYNLSNQLN